MPMRVEDRSQGGVGYATPFVGPVDHTEVIVVDLASMTAAEVDAKGYLKPGVPLAADGKLVGEDGVVHGVTIEPLKVTDASGDRYSSMPVALAVIGAVNKDIIEDNLGRALTADEVAGFSAAGCLIRLIA